MTTAPSASAAPISRPRRWLRRMVVALLLGIPGAWLAHRWAWPPLRVSPETTVITSPLLPDGRPDYVTYLNAKYSEGVTPENNAAVILVRLVGGTRIPEPIREEYCRRLGVPVPDDETALRYWKEFAQVKELDKDRINELTEIADHDQSRFRLDEHPELVEYLAFHEPMFELLEQALARDQFFSPILTRGRPEYSNLAADPLLSLFPQSASLLLLRSQFRERMGDRPAALRDVFLVYRIGRLLRQLPVPIMHHVAISLDRLAFDRLSEVILSRNLMIDDVALLRDLLRILPPLPLEAGVSTTFERFGLLDQVIALGRGEEGMWIFQSPDFRTVTVKLAAGTNVNRMLKEVNRQVDQLVEIASVRGPRERAKRLQEWDTQGSTVTPPETSPFIKWAYDKLKKKPPIFVGLQHTTALVNPESTWLRYADKNRVRWQLLEAGLLVAQFHAVLGRFPESLAELNQEIATGPPNDFWTGQPLHYTARDGGFLLWSSGENGQNDGGWEEHEFESMNLEADDVRFGLKPVERIDNRTDSSPQ